MGKLVIERKGEAREAGDAVQRFWGWKEESERRCGEGDIFFVMSVFEAFGSAPALGFMGHRIALVDL
jgi:hypothetical protein